jgi:hypothetical protein
LLRDANGINDEKEASMKRLLSVTALALVMCTTLSGSAWADSTQTRSITVNGNASRPISQSSSQAAVDTTYRSAINDAIDAALGKATSIAVKLGATLGPVVSFTENYGDTWCPGNGAAVPTPAITGAGGSGNVGPSGGYLRLPPIKHHKRPQHHHLHAADESPICTISADITVSYEIS